MTSPVATINGVKVYSDKQMSSIVNSRITFSDGSYADVSTGEVVNKGHGYVSIGAPASSGGEQVTVGPKTFTGVLSLDVRDVVAGVDVQLSKDRSTTVTITGPKSDVDNIEVREQSSTLLIAGKNASGRGRSGITISTGGSAFVGGGVFIGGSISGRRGSGGIVVMSSDDSESSTKVLVKVPKGTTVTVAGIQGLATIGDTEGTLYASVLGGSDINAGKVRGATLSIQGGGDITVAEVSEALSMNIQGSGDIRVRKGNVTSLSVNVMGSGDARFGGSATDATLSVMGSGDINVNHVENRPMKNSMGSGDITVGNW